MKVPVQLTTGKEDYGFGRMPSGHTDTDPSRVARLPYGRFRNVYLYITEACQLRCTHCYMGDRLERALKMPLPKIASTLETWRKLGGSKLTILGGEPTLHPGFVQSIHIARDLGYEHVITTTNGLNPAMRKLRTMEPADFAYVQISLDGGTTDTHDQVRGAGTFAETIQNVEELCKLGFDTRIICTVNGNNMGDVLNLLSIADGSGVSLVKYHVFSTIGTGGHNPDMSVPPREWLEFCERLKSIASHYNTRVWYQPTYADVSQVGDYANAGYRGCIGRTLDRISIFPDGRCYVCSYMFDTNLHFAEMIDGRVQLNKGDNEFDLFTRTLCNHECGEGNCKSPGVCQGGCPAERLVMGQASCAAEPNIVPICRLWKADAKESRS